jgi:hypothetical protein
MAQYQRFKEKVRSSVYRLAVGEGDVRDRLRRAYKELRSLRREDVPPELLDEWKSILSALTRLGPERDSDGDIYQTSITHTLSRIRNSTGRKIAERIWALNWESN